MPYLYVSLSCVFFALASQGFTHYSQKISSVWVNAAKALVATLGFALLIALGHPWTELSSQSTGLLLLSGFFGLGVGDIMLVLAFTRLGPSRTLMIFGFRPAFLEVYRLWRTGEPLGPLESVALGCMFICMFIFLQEKKGVSEETRMTSSGLMLAVLATLCDTTGVILSKEVFLASPEVTSVQVNLVRGLGALGVFLLLTLWQRQRYFQRFFSLEIRDKSIFLGCALIGTFFSLILYLQGIKEGNLTLVSAVGITIPLWSQLFERLIYRRSPSKQLIYSFLFFCLGFSCMLVKGP